MCVGEMEGKDKEHSHVRLLVKSELIQFLQTDLVPVKSTVRWVWGVRREVCGRDGTKNINKTH